MSITRASVRDGIVTLLTDATDAEDRVYASRQPPVEGAHLPCILVYNEGDSNTRRGDGGPMRFKRTQRIAVEAIAQGATDAATEEAVEDLSDQIEEAIYSSATWPEDFERVGDFERRTGRDVKDKRRGAALYTIEVEYGVFFEPTAEDDLQSVHVDVKMIEPESGNDSDATLVVEDLDA